MTSGTKNLKRVAGVEDAPSLPDVAPPPAHDRVGAGASSPDEASGSRRSPAPTPASPSEAFGLHFFRCFFCRVGDYYRREPAHFCEAGEGLLIAMLDEVAEREWNR